VLAAQYESWLLPLVVVLSVPLAALGALGILALRAIPLNVFAQIGLLVLVGLAAKNGILLVAFAQEKRAEGADRLEAAKLAARLRMRPIVMTALAFILGTLPLAIASGAGANARIAIGSTVIGGMAVATILTLFITPAFYVAADRFASRGKRQDEAPDAAQETTEAGA
jgi:multidrug efflux pump subunit AcrB